MAAHPEIPSRGVRKPLSWLAVVLSSLALAVAAGVTPAQTATTWPFTPGKDPFKPDALLDLRDLNEKEAGAKGFVRLGADGSGFVLGDGTPVRFWAVGDTVYTKTDAELAYHAR